MVVDVFPCQDAGPARAANWRGNKRVRKESACTEHGEGEERRKKSRWVGQPRGPAAIKQFTSFQSGVKREVD